MPAIDLMNAAVSELARVSQSARSAHPEHNELKDQVLATAKAMQAVLQDQEARLAAIEGR